MSYSLMSGLHLNTNLLIKKAYARMQLLHEMSNFGAPLSDMKDIYVLFIRSYLEQSSSVWHSSLTQDNIDDLERVQKSAFKIMINKTKGINLHRLCFPSAFYQLSHCASTYALHVP